MQQRQRPPREPISAGQLFLIIWGPVALIWIALGIKAEGDRARASSERTNAEYEALIRHQEAENAIAEIERRQFGNQAEVR